MIPPETAKAMRQDFARRFTKIQALVAEGRGIEILIRILDQTREGLAAVDESYESMMASTLQIPSLHPKQSMPRLLPGAPDREQVELARDIADKVAHGLFWHARQLIDIYAQRFPLKARLSSEGMNGWSVKAKGMLIDHDGRRVEAILDTLMSSQDNLTIEEFDLFVYNGYFAAAREIFATAMSTLAKNQPSLAIDAVRLHMFRGLKRGRRIYPNTENDQDAQ